MRLAGICIGLIGWAVLASHAIAEDSVEIIRDQWGVAHVYGDSEEAAFFGAGYATAEDRILQICLVRRETQGRLAAALGAGKNDQYVNSDRKYRILGFDRRAKELVDTLQPDSRRNLDAYAAGINAYLKDDADGVASKFAKYGGKPEPWAAADSIALWMRNGFTFTTGWEDEVTAKREYERALAEKGPDAPIPGTKFIRDDAVAVVSEQEYKRTDPKSYRKIKAVEKDREQPGAFLHTPDRTVKASHTWVVSGKRSTTGKPILESDPQITVSFPGLFYDIHMVGGRYNIRGATIPGTAGYLIGFNENIAWGGSALGGDCADLFEEKVNPNNPNEYLYKGESKPFETRKETIQVKDGKPIEFVVRSTIHGPVANDLLKGVKPGEVYSLQYTINKEQQSSLEAILEMMRATDWNSFRKGMSGYTAPPLNVVYADVHGTIAYNPLTAVPKRFGLEPLPRQGWTGEDEWEMLPFEDMPYIVNPESQTIHSANHLPVGSWYPYVITTTRGEGPRGWRLRELLAGDQILSVDDFWKEIHLDCTNPALRNLVEMAIAIYEEEGTTDPNIQSAIRQLKEWDFRIHTESPQFALAESILQSIDKQALGNFAYEEYYGDRWAGVDRLLRELYEEYQQTKSTPKAPEFRTWLKDTFKQGVELARTSDQFEPPRTHHMPYQTNIGKLGSLDPGKDLVSPPLACPEIQTIWSQGGETYVQIVDLSDLDQSLSLNPPGVSEDPENARSQQQMQMWADGGLHPAPLSKKAVMAIKESSKKLSYSPSK